MDKVPAVDMAKLLFIFGQMERNGVAYGLGAKAPYLSCSPGDIKRIDCSGLVRYLIYQSTEAALTIPDGSQMQREWCENSGLHQLAKYSDANTYGNANRLFLAFIKPNTNGCGPVGHVWLVTKLAGDDVSDTLESRGGVGVDSRPWNALTLRRQVYSCYELPVKAVK